MTSTCRRMDSTLINSNIRKLTRNDVIYLVAKMWFVSRLNS
ncbi:hypothetical protein [Pasteuria penetrans]|nr:hypothetical protein [Pasteuria penetrans]